MQKITVQKITVQKIAMQRISVAKFLLLWFATPPAISHNPLLTSWFDVRVNYIDLLCFATLPAFP